MVIASVPPRSPRQAPPPPPPQEESFWKEFDHDVREFLLHADPDKFREFGQLVKTIGNAVRGVWKIVDPQDIVQDDPKWASISDTVGVAAGLTAAGGAAVLGITKLVRGFRAGHTGKKLDGLVDLGAATTLTLAALTLGTAKLVAAPLTATLNAVRGGYNVIRGFKQNDERKQLQGLLDISRSLGGFSRSFKRFSPILGVAGIVLAPVAGLLQTGRGVHDLSIGLKNDDKKRMVRGLADMATAVGTTMAFASGVAVVPGVVLAVAANVLKGAYQVSPRFRGWVNQKLDKHEARLEKFVHGADKVTKPFVKAWRRLLDNFFPGDAWTTPPHYSQAQLSEITALLQVDGEYTPEERECYKAALEDTGQARETPPLNTPPVAPRRAELLKELKSPQQRRNFLHFMISVADYDTRTVATEKDYLRRLSQDLGLREKDFDMMLKDYLHEKLIKAGLRKPGRS
ncbi:MAG: TerB family tellurite resistance protein [Candidatus Eremiobacteraeota bacterium]|nr:TerB family tellurite resistance protein [Candidatus Eremiobacteraeota bacterium]MCW5870092.1 TerB family tellurite resistance protein [Candidatus Eremiobacteraeota bacterium]